MLSSFAARSACVLAASTQFDYLPVGIRELHSGDSESTRLPARTRPFLEGSCALDPLANCRNLLWLLARRALFETFWLLVAVDGPSGSGRDCFDVRATGWAVAPGVGPDRLVEVAFDVLQAAVFGLGDLQPEVGQRDDG